jgi:hypothetical protein
MKKRWIEVEIEEGNLRFTVGAYVYSDRTVMDAVVVEKPTIDADEYHEQLLEEYGRQCDDKDE